MSEWYLNLDVPAKVVDVVKRGVSWLYRNVLSGRFRPWNAFFSGSVKSFVSIHLNFLNIKCPTWKTEKYAEYYRIILQVANF